MRRILSLTLISLVTILTAACGSSTPAPENVAKVEGDCAQPATPPKEGETPVCTEGCSWLGEKCSRQRGIIVHDSVPSPPPKPRDSDKDTKEIKDTKDKDKDKK